MFADGSNAIRDGRSISPRHRPLVQRRREGFFATSQSRRLKRGVFRSVADLQAAINRYLEEHNQLSKAFTWTADPDKIIAAVRRGHPSVRFDPLALDGSIDHSTYLLGSYRTPR